MLKKLPELEIVKSNPFINDKLARFECAENLTNLIQATSEPFVLSINSPWGNGKTTFIKMWAQYLTNRGHPCVYFNAWENDFSDDPLISFISEIEHYIEEQAFPDSRAKKTKGFKKVKGFTN